MYLGCIIYIIIYYIILTNGDKTSGCLIGFCCISNIRYCVCLGCISRLLDWKTRRGYKKIIKDKKKTTKQKPTVVLYFMSCSPYGDFSCS